MPALHPPSATPTASHLNAKLNALHSWFRNLGLILGYDAPFLHSHSAVRTPPPAGVRRLPHRRFAEWADDIAARIGSLLCVQVFVHAPWDPAERREPLDAWPIATLLPTNVADARSLSSALQSLALGGQSFLKFPVPHDRLTTCESKQIMFGGSTFTLNNYNKSTYCHRADSPPSVSSQNTSHDGRDNRC